MTNLDSVFDEILSADQVSAEAVLRLCEELREADQESSTISEEDFLEVASRLAESEYVDALLVFDFAADCFPHSMDILINRARCARAFGYMQAAGSFFLAIAREFDAAGGERFYAEAASCFLDAGMGQEALDAGQACWRLSQPGGDRAAADFLIGRAYLLLRRANLARDRFFSCLEALPSFRAAGEYLLISAAQSGNIAASAELFKQIDDLGWLSSGLIDSIISILTNLGRYREAIEIFGLTARRFDLLPSTFHNVAEAQRSVGDNVSAIATYDKAKATFPEFENLATLVSQAHAYGNVGRLEDKRVVEERARRLLEEIDGEVSINPWMLFSFVDDPVLLSNCARAFSASALGAPVSDSSQNESLRLSCDEAFTPSASSREIFSESFKIVFVSAELRFHPVAECLLALLSRKPSWVEVCLISIHPVRDPMTEKLVGLAEAFHDCHGLDFEEIKAICQGFGAQAAVDLTGYTASSRADVFVKRLAPYQINYLGFSGTLGSLAYDAIIADETIIPDGHELYFSETVIRLDIPLLSMNFGSFLSHKRDEERALLGVTREEVVFGCLAKSYKLSIELVEAWSRILDLVPRSILVLPEANFAEFSSMMRKFGINASRLRGSAFRPDRASHLERLSSFDVFLDSFPYNAHSLAADALLAETPVLAFSGSTFASRVSASLMVGVGCEDLVANDIDDYVSIAEKLGNDQHYLREVKTRIRTALASKDWGRVYAEMFFERIKGGALGIDR